MSKKSKEKKVFYYKDELNDDFAGTNIKTQCVDSNFKFIHRSILWRSVAFFLYYFVAYPLVFIYEKLILRVRFVNKKALRKYKKQAIFIYGNHTGFYDAFTPNLIAHPHRNMIIVGPDTVSIKGLRTIVQMLGAIPIPNGVKELGKFIECVDYHVEKNASITVYPEAHIWPYYTGVRPFPDTSFSYPIKHNTPTFAFFTAYTKPRGLFSCFRKANITVYVSEPIFPDAGLSERERRKNLCDKVYSFMLEKSKLSDYNVIEYVCSSEKSPANEAE